MLPIIYYSIILTIASWSEFPLKAHAVKIQTTTNSLSYLDCINLKAYPDAKSNGCLIFDKKHRRGSGGIVPPHMEDRIKRKNKGKRKAGDRYQGKVPLRGQTIFLQMSSDGDEGSENAEGEGGEEGGEGSEGDADGGNATLVNKKEEKEEKCATRKEVREIVEDFTGGISQKLSLRSDQLREQINDTYTDFENTFNAHVDVFKLETERFKNETQQRLDELYAKVMESEQKADELALIVIKEQLEKLSQELNEVMKNITELRSKIPGAATSVCSLYATCDTCTANLKCGWCITEQKCVEGNDKGPFYETCAFFDYRACSGTNCVRFPDCQVRVKILFSSLKRRRFSLGLLDRSFLRLVPELNQEN
jgi:hypothetical protein